MVKIKESLKLLLTIAVICAFLFAGADVVAAGSHHGGGHYGGHYGGGRHYSGSFGVYFGAPYWGWGPWYSPYYYPYYYPYYPYPYPQPPAVTVPSLPEEYIQRSGPDERTAEPPPNVWYYCPESKAYYPYVKECPGGWQTVPAEPPSGTGR
jgi:hypothetical protein